MKTHFFLLTVLWCLFCWQCSDSSSAVDADIKHSDSLAQRLSSPELKNINELLRKNPSESSLYFQRGVIYRKLRMWKESENDLQRAIRLDSNHVEYYMELADLYFTSNQGRKCKETLEKIIMRFPKHTDAYLKLGELYYIVKQYKFAADEVNKALKLESDRADAYFLRGNIYREWGDTNRAISSLQTATELEPENNDYWYDLGILYFYKHSPLAVPVLQKAVSLKRSTRNLYALAQAFHKKGEYEPALRYYDSILMLDSTYLQAWYAKGALLADERKNYSEAEKIFMYIRQKDSFYVPARMALAWCWENTGKKHQAKEEYKKILKLHPDYTAAVEELNRLSGSK